MSASCPQNFRFCWTRNPRGQTSTRGPSVGSSKPKAVAAACYVGFLTPGHLHAGQGGTHLGEKLALLYNGVQEGLVWNSGFSWLATLGGFLFVHNYKWVTSEP